MEITKKLQMDGIAAFAAAYGKGGGGARKGQGCDLTPRAFIRVTMTDVHLAIINELL
jgi:hypothetical protein